MRREIALVALLLFAAPASVRAQEPREAPARTLEELEAERDQVVARHHRTLVAIQGLKSFLDKLEAKLELATRRARQLQLQPAGVLRDQALNEARREQKEAGRRLAAKRMVLEAEREAEKVRRRQLIQIHWAVVDRRIELADRALRLGRKEQAEGHTRAARDGMEEVALLEQVEDAPAAEVKPVELDSGAPEQELRELQEFYELLAEEAEHQAAELLPSERIRAERVRHLDGLRKYVLPNLAQTLERERLALQRISVLRRKAEERAMIYRREAARIESLLFERALEAQERKERP